jgi:hypothetical protein
LLYKLMFILLWILCPTAYMQSKNGRKCEIWVKISD